MGTIAEKYGKENAPVEVESGMVRRLPIPVIPIQAIPIWVLAFLSLAWCRAPGQVQDRERSSWPDAPSVQAASAETFRTVAEGLPLSSNSVSAEEFHWTDSVRAMQAGFGDLEKPARKEGADFFSQHFRAALANRNPKYRPLASGSLLGRATYAASRTFIASDPSGKEKVNTSYFLGVLTSALVHTAYRPYWNRPVSAPFGDFGSTIGNDAGMNVLHEFGPGLQQLVKNHTPQFVSRIAERLGK